jgi:hypothetical protein
MRVRADEEFLHEVERFALRFTCESCLHFDRDAHACGNGWPTAEHLEAPPPGGLVVFCKEFETV